MSTPFIAPPPPPPLRTSKENIVEDTQTRIQLPAHVRPALARWRTPILANGESIGALNSSPVPRSISPSPPPIPPRPSQLSRQNLLSLDIQPDIDDISQSSISRSSALSDTQFSHFGSVLTRSNSNESLEPKAPIVPLLVITPPGALGAPDVSQQSPSRVDTLPPSISQPQLTNQKYPGPPGAIKGTPLPSSSIDSHISGQQHHSLINETPILPILLPPLHPNRRLSPAPSFITLPNPSSTLRRRAQSHTSNRGSLVSPNRPTILDHARKGSCASVLTLKDENLTDEDLQKLYDAEEVERYLRLFASRVNEVVIHPDHADTDIPAEAQLPLYLQNPSTPFESIAAFLYPYAPQNPPPQTKRRFKLSRAASSAQRLYLAIYAAYVPPIVHLVRLSAWKDPKRSGIWCLVYWMAWAWGLLTPLATGLIFYAMVTGGTVTRKEIKRRREAAREAEALGKAIQGGIPGVGVSGNLGVWDMVKLVRNVAKKKQKKAKTVIDEITKDGEGEFVVDSEGEMDESEDWKLTLLDQMDELADLHERVKNIFLHRQPELTRKYSIISAALFLATLFIQNTSQIITLIIGVAFWFALPITTHLPNPPPAFGDAPTDAEVAMDLIAQRVARGERVVPERISKRKKIKEKDQINTKSNTSVLDLNEADSPTIRSPSKTSFFPGPEGSDEEAPLVVPTRTIEPTVPRGDKSRERAGRVSNWLGKTKQIVNQVRGVEGKGTSSGVSEQNFPAWHRSGLGILTVSPNLLTFSLIFSPATPVLPSSNDNSVEIDIQHLRGVKKASPSGLVVQYTKGSEMAEERFLFVSRRDEAFATLVGRGGGKWKHI